jgi:hypothetical protein
MSETPSVTSKDVERYADRDPILSKVRDYVMYGWREVNDPEIKFIRRKRTNCQSIKISFIVDYICTLTH